MREKRHDIPALYNDISQSQDTNSVNIIKPWTPNKIVIAKNSNSEIAISSTNNNDNREGNGDGGSGDGIKNGSKSDNDNSGNHTDKNEQNGEIQKNVTTTIPIVESNSKSPKKIPAKRQQRQRSLSKIDNNSSSPTKNNPQTISLNSESVLKTQRSPIKRKINNLTGNSSVQERNTVPEKTKQKNDAKDNDNAEDINDGNSDNSDKSLTKNVDQILNTINVQIENEQKRRKLLRQLKSIKIDTVEGNTVVQGKLRRRASIAATPDPEDEDGSGGNNSRRKKRAKLSNKGTPPNNHNNDNNQAVKTATTKTITTEIVSKDDNKSRTKQVTEPSLSTTTTKPVRKSLIFENNKNKGYGEQCQNIETSFKMAMANDLDSMPQLLPSSNEEDVLKSATGAERKTATEATATAAVSNDEKEKTGNDSSLEEVIGSSQQCESVFAKKVRNSRYC